MGRGGGANNDVLLLTGFGAFGSHAINPTAQVVGLLDGSEVDGAPVRGIVFDASTGRVADQLNQALDLIEPTVVVATGVAPRRPALSLERVAVNLRDFSIPDCDGEVLVEAPVLEGGREAFFSGLPLREILANWRAAGVPGHISNSAGTYLCNQLFYLVCNEAQRRGFTGGFIHVPDTMESALTVGEFPEPQPTVALATIELGLRLALGTALATRNASVLVG